MSGLPYTVGDSVRLAVDVTDAGGVPDDPATISLTITLPDHTAVPVPSGDIIRTGPGAYLYDYPTTVPGRHMARYATTLPDGTFVIEFDVSPALDTTTPHAPVYATPAQYRQVTGQDPPPDALRKLADASELVDDLLIGAVYEVDEDTDLPTDPKVASALARAVCRQVQWWELTGDPHGVTNVYPSVSIGSVSLARGGGAASGPPSAADRIAPDALSALRVAGILPTFAITSG